MSGLRYLINRNEFTDDFEFKNNYIIEDTTILLNENGGIKDNYLPPEKEVLKFDDYIRTCDN